MSQGLPRRLRFAFLMQVAMASVVIVAGAYVALQIAKQDVAARTLRDEAAYYWQQRAIDPARVAPDGAMLHGYAIPVGASAASLPDTLRTLEPGLHNLPDMLVLVQRRDEVQLYLTYPQSRIDRIALQLILAPVLLALLAVALSSWFTYRIARRMTAPLHWLAREVRRWDPRDPDVSALAPDKLPIGAGIETRQLAGALQRMGERMRLFVHRERDFTRDASHELRTPLTVIRVASDLMQSDPDLPQRVAPLAGADAARGPRHGGGDRRVPAPRARRRNRAAAARISSSPTSSTRKWKRRGRCWPASRSSCSGQCAHVAAPACVAARARRDGRQPARQRLRVHRARARSR